EARAGLQRLNRTAVTDDDLQLTDGRVLRDLHRDALDIFAAAFGAGEGLNFDLLAGPDVRVVDPKVVELTRIARVTRRYVVNQLLELQVFEAAVEDGADRLRRGEGRSQRGVEGGRQAVLYLHVRQPLELDPPANLQSRIADCALGRGDGR